MPLVYMAMGMGAAILMGGEGINRAGEGTTKIGDGAMKIAAAGAAIGLMFYLYRK